MIKVAIAEDNNFLIHSFKERIKKYSDLSVKITAKNGLDIISKININHNIDVILMDIQMPKLNGIEATEIIKSKYPHIKIIMLTIYDGDIEIFDAIKAGADGYLLKETNAEDLYKGILNVLNGGAAMTPSIALRTLHFLKTNSKPSAQAKQEETINLTKRESEILEQLSKGLNYKLIAENLIVSPSTIRKHIENIYTKLQVHSKVEAIQKGIKHNLI